MRQPTLLIAFAALLATNTAVAQSQSRRGSDFTYFALDTAPDVHSWAAAVNDRGVVAGTATTSASTLMGSGFIWTASAGVTTIVNDAVVWDINNKGQVVGRHLCSTEIDCASGFVWSESTGVQDLGEFFPFAVNDRGNMAGTCGDLTACALIDGAIIAIPVNPNMSIAFDINDRNVVAGSTYRPVDDGGMAPLAFTWSAHEGVTMLNAGDADDTIAMAINSHGVVAGTVTYNGPNSRVNAAVWRRGELLVLAGGDWTAARAINNRGWTAGHLSVGGNTENVPMAWIPGQDPVQLPLAGGGAGFATGINKSGQITGRVYTAAGRMHAVVWLPQ